jgi:hypothetical protein
LCLPAEDSCDRLARGRDSRGAWQKGPELSLNLRGNSLGARQLSLFQGLKKAVQSMKVNTPLFTWVNFSGVCGLHDPARHS